MLKIDAETGSLIVAHPHLVHEELVAPLAERLRTIHRDVGIADERVDARVVTRADGDADARGYHDVAACELKGFRKLVKERLREHYWRRLRDALEQDDELIATDAGDYIVGTQVTLEAAGDRDEQQIGDCVAEGVVDERKAVEIDE